VNDVPVSLTVLETPLPAFTVVAETTSRRVTRGQSSTFTVTVQSTNGFNSPVGFEALYLPAGVVAKGTGWSPAVVKPAADGSATATLTIVTGKATATGAATVTLRATAGTLTRDVPVTLTVAAAADSR
jgi:hypothetical protein